MESIRRCTQMLIDNETGLTIGDSSKTLFPDVQAIDLTALCRAIEKRRKGGIASASGIRQVFDATRGDEPSDFVDGRGTEITDAAKAYVATIAGTFVDYLARSKGPSSGPVKIVVGIDTRPTGTAIADVVVRMLLAKGVDVRYIFVAAVTKAVVYTRESADGFIYISASHNPIGYNGVKLGLADGRTLPAKESYEFIAEYEAALSDPGRIRDTIVRVNGVPAEDVQRVFADIDRWRAEARAVYGEFCDCIMTGALDPREAQEKKAHLSKQVRAMDLWIGLDPNGGARQDRDYLESWGFHVAEINARLRADIVHELAPTPTASEAARKEMLRLQSEGKKIVAFFVFDTDGDRRNIVVPDGRGGAFLPGIQTVFALDILAAVGEKIERGELTYDAQGKARERVGVAVNDATSSLMERIAERFDFVLRRVETGEASVARGGELLAEEGVDVVMMGEGSNGSAFTLALLVREPIHTIHSIVSLISRPSLVRALVGRLAPDVDCSGWRRPDKITSLIANVISVLPPSETTDVFTSAGERRGLPLPQYLFKAEFDALFEEVWPGRRRDLAEGFVDDPSQFSYEFVTCELENELRGRGNRKRQTGGYKIELFANTNGRKRLAAWIWFRVSMTERGLTRRAASVAHWDLSPAAAELVKRKQKQFDSLLEELLAEAERRAVDHVRSRFPKDSDERRELETALEKRR
ncbi:MAG: hypothetical protein AB1696_01400 [Planctomycetota bacterium]